MAFKMVVLVFTFTLISSLLLASIVDSRPLLSTQSRMGRSNHSMGINMTSNEDEDANSMRQSVERSSNGNAMTNSQHVKVAHSWLAGEGRRDLIGLDLTPSESQQPAQTQTESSSSNPQTSITSSISNSIPEIAESYGLSPTEWNWEFPSPFQSSVPTGVGLQSTTLLSQIPALDNSNSILNEETVSGLGSTSLSDDLAPAVIGRLVHKTTVLTPQEIEKLEIERLNEEELNGYDSYFNNSKIYSRSNSEDQSEKGSKPSPSIPNSALPTSDSGIYASNWLSNSLNLYQRRVLVGAENLNFVEDPSQGTERTVENGGNGSVLRVFYPNNSYSPSHSDPVGGVSFYAQPFAISPESDAVTLNSTSLNSTSGNDSTSLGAKDDSSNKPSQPRVLLPALSSLPLGASSLLSSTSNTSSSSNEYSTSKPSLLLSYSVYFPFDFDFVKGGKLPGLYSSTGEINETTGLIDANTDSCSGGAGNQAGKSCWSVRIMWREGGEGEAYLYIPIEKKGQYDPCGTTEDGNEGEIRENWICNNDYGVSLGRGKFSFVKGGWTNLSLFVQLNSKPSIANGLLGVWSNGVPVIQESNLLFRTGREFTLKTGKGGGSGDSNASKRNVQLPFETTDEMTTKVEDKVQGQWVDKIFFSSFFGGSTSDFAATSDSYTYFKDVSLHAGTSVSNQTGLDASNSKTKSKSNSANSNKEISILSILTLAAILFSISF